MDGLRVLGFRASVAGLRQILTVSTALDSHFQTLEAIFPNAQKILRDFRSSKIILELLDSAPEFPTSEPIQSNEADRYCTALGQKDFNPINRDDFPIQAELIAFFWLAQSSKNAQPNVVVSESLARLLETSIFFVEQPSIVRIAPELAGHSPGFFNDVDGITTWLDYASDAYISWGAKSFVMHDIRACFSEACDLAQQLNPTKFAPQPFLHEEDLGEQQSEPIQRGSSLRERERLVLHHNAFQVLEAKTFFRNVRRNIEQDRRGYDVTGTEYSYQYYFEALIAGVALATGRTVRGAIEMSLDADDHEHIAIRSFPGYKSHFNYPIWTRKLSPTKTLTLPLPDFLSCLADSLYFKGAQTLADCLPYSLVDWEQRCFEWLDGQFSSSGSKLDRRIRDALPRALYQHSANPALLDWITTPVQKMHRQTESLSYYLNPSSENTYIAYAAVCKNMFHAYGAPVSIRSLLLKNVADVSVEEHRQISDCFVTDLKQAESSKDLIASHNSLARYILMLLIVATGHRKSTTPFFFRWDILISENLVFISDKLVVGSEARFVPIPEWLSNVVATYLQHLVELAHKLRSVDSHLAEQVSNLLNDNFEPIRTQLGESDEHSPYQKSFGLFFLIDEKFKAKTIATHDLEEFYKIASPVPIGRFRKNIANALWSQNLSGQQIEAFLGHNGDLHCFGESSAWSILQWAEAVRQAQDQYLADCGWKEIGISLNPHQSTALPFTPPRFDKSRSSYEGRHLDKKSAEARARMIIRDLLPAEWFDYDNAKITDEDVIALREAARSRMADDPKSAEQVSRVIAEEIQKIRGTVGKMISSNIANLTRTESGPISVSSSRHHAIATTVRAWWIGRLGEFSSRDTAESYMDRLAAIGISLIIFDAVLDEKTWSSLLMAIASHESRSAQGCLVVRVGVKKSARMYDKAVILSPYTAAQIVGLEHQFPSNETDGQIIKKISARIVKWLKSAPHSGDGLSLLGLFVVFKAWWMLRLPGTAFAIAAAEYSGPAPDLVSECALYGIQRHDLIETDSIVDDIREILVKPKLDSSAAKARINELLNEATGSFELKQQTSRWQRSRLLILLNDSELHAELKEIANQNPIVSAMLGFLQYLLVEGGMRVADYRFGSIRTLFSHIISLVDTWWERDIDNLESSEFDQAYTALLVKSDQAGLAVWRFHQFLRATYGVPHSSKAASYKRSEAQCRSSLITTAQFDKAWHDINAIKDDGQLAGHTKTFLGLSYQYALRNREAIGLELKHVLPPRPYRIRVEKNNVRDLKTKKASLRVVDHVLANARCQKYFEGIVALHQVAPVGDTSLFADAEKRDALYSKSRINQATTVALRAATKNASVVPYSMRHTAATRLAHFAIRAPRQIPLSPFVETALRGEIEEASITSCFEQGFDAWPFWTDRVAMFLGHTSVDTMLNTYWHSSHVRLAELTWHACEDVELTHQQFSSILGRDRSSISKKLTGLKSNGLCVGSQLQEALIAHYIDKSTISILGEDLEEDSFDRSLITQQEGLNDLEFSGSWVALHRILIARLQNNLSLDETRQLATSFNLSGEDAAAFWGAYENIVLNSGFDDFEPPNSEIMVGAPKRHAGIARGMAERERGIAAANRLSNLSELFSAKLETFTNMWCERINPEAPWFVARNAPELELILEVLKEIGVKRSQFEFVSCNFDKSTLSGALTKTEIEGAGEQKFRVSYGPRNSIIREFGVRVKQQVDTKIGDYRDTHRLALILAAIVRAKLGS